MDVTTKSNHNKLGAILEKNLNRTTTLFLTYIGGGSASAIHGNVTVVLQ